jgi:hypothetical protein
VVVCRGRGRRRRRREQEEQKGANEFRGPDSLCSRERDDWPVRYTRGGCNLSSLPLPRAREPKDQVPRWSAAAAPIRGVTPAVWGAGVCCCWTRRRPRARARCLNGFRFRLRLRLDIVQVVKRLCSIFKACNDPASAS